MSLVTKSVAKSNQPFQVLTRIAIEELEAWLFGDILQVELGKH